MAETEQFHKSDLPVEPGGADGEGQAAAERGLPLLKKITPPPPASSGNNDMVRPPKNFGSTHRVKQLLETYSMTAEKTLMGPEAVVAAAGEEKYHSYLMAAGNGARDSTYKLPPDVELSKTIRQRSSEDHGGPDPKTRHQVQVRTDLTSKSELTNAAAAAIAMNAVSEKLQQNGLVTLSRIENPNRHVERQNAYMAALQHQQRLDHDRERHLSAPLIERVRTKSGEDRMVAAAAMASMNGSRQQHLTGEMIRQIRQQQKLKGEPPISAAAAQFQQRVMAAAAQQTATIAALQQHNLQMQAAYERALKDKTYLRPKTSSLSESDRPFKPPATTAAPNVSAPPPLLTRDPGHDAKLQETKLGGKDIACFNIGGEARCCLPQILNSILDQISLHAIHLSCDELQIYCSTCTHDQMEVLKNAKIIPFSASQCGLITKSDAERLVSMLLDRNPPRASLSGFRAKSSPFSFRVQHGCFGDCQGIVLPEAYTNPMAKCIECLECEGLYCPQKFVCHSHSPKNRICHWGFDSSNWRSYIQLSEDYSDQEQEKLDKYLIDFKARYKPIKRKTGTEPINGGQQKDDKLVEAAETSPLSPTNHKKLRLSSEHHSDHLPPPPPQPSSAGFDPYSMYLFQNWTKLNPGITAGMHPAAAAALFAQSLKDGKIPAGNGHQLSPGAANPLLKRVSSLDRSPHRGHHHSGGPGYPGAPLSGSGLGGPSRSLSAERLQQVPLHRSGSNRIQMPVKSSPISSSDGCSPPDKDIIEGEDAAGSTSRAGRRIKSTSTSSTSSTSLAEDIHSIRLALDGASVTAKERTLKTLERLTARLALAESERDLALNDLSDLQKRFRFLEDELQKKRAELRDALRQDNASPRFGSSDSGERRRGSYESSSQFQANGASSGSNNRSDVTLEILSEGQPAPNRLFDDQHATDLRLKHGGGDADYQPYPKRSRLESYKAESQHVKAAPTPDDKKPPPPLSPKPDDDAKRPVSLPKEEYPLPAGTTRPVMMQRRTSCGTPTSIKSREESEDLRDRMMTMEAELRALREELSHRGSSVSSSEEPRETNKDKEQSNASTPEPKPMKKLLHERQMSMELEVNGNADSAKPRTNGTLGSSGDQTTSEEEESSGDDLMQPEKRLSIQDEDLENKTDVKKTPKQSDDQDEKSGPADQEQEPEQAKT